jgi:uncharacterized membrane protein YqjE
VTATNPPDASLGDLFAELGADLSQLVRKELELAKVEAREEAHRLTRAATFGALAGVAALLALVLLSMALAWWIDEALHTAVAFALVGAMWIVIAAIAASITRTAVGDIRPLPETADAIKAAVTGERATEASSHGTDATVLTPTHQLTEPDRTTAIRTNPSHANPNSTNKETAS